MKYKGIGFFDKHLEKIVVAVAAIIALIIIYVYCLGSPYAIQTSDGELAPSEVQTKLLDDANALDAEIRSDKVHIEAVRIPDYSQVFEQMRQQPLVPVEQFSPLAGGPGLSSAVIGDMTVDTQRQYELAERPQPQNVKARADFAVLASEQEMTELFAAQMGESPDEQAWQQAQRDAQQYVQLIGMRQPRDFWYVSIKAQFDMRAYLQQFQTVPESKRVPDDWQVPSMFITDVAVERQTFDPATGEWVETKVIPVLPRALSLRNKVQADFRDKFEAQEFLNWVRAEVVQQRLTQHPFPPTTDVRGWVPPDTQLDQLSPDEQRAYLDLTQKIRRVEKQIERLGGTVPAERGTQTQPGALPPFDGPMPEEFGPMPPMMREPEVRPPGSRQPQPQAQPQPRPQRDRSQEEQQRRQALIDQLVKQLMKLREDRDIVEGVAPAEDSMTPGDPRLPAARRGAQPQRDPRFADPDLEPGMDPRVDSRADPRSRDADAFRMPGQRQEQQVVEQAPQRLEDRYGPVDIVTHDITALPGRTYRYRVRVSVLNPLFYQDNLADEQREQFRNLMSLESPWSEWTQPITIEPRTRFFVVSSSQPGRATVELYSVFNGRYRMTDIEVGPGDPIQTSRPIRDSDFEGELVMAVDKVVVDVEAATTAGPLGLTNTRNVQVLLYDQSSGAIQQRSASADRDNPDRTRLRFEVDRAAGVASAE